MLRALTPTHRLLSTVAVLVALLAAAGAVSGPAPAAFPGANGKLAFVRAGDIWVVDADGSNPTQLTTDPAQERSPAFSPDGTEIAFARRNDDFEIFVMAARAGDIARQLTSNEGEQDRFPSWTADGSQIVYDKDFAAIYAVPADGAGGERKIATGFLPGTSPHGEKVVFAAPANDGLVTMHLDGSQQRRITMGPFDFSADWSPHGNDLVFTRSFAEGDRDVYAVHADGSELVRLMNTPERFEFAPVWSPDGEQIAFVGCPDPSAGPGCQLYVVGRDGDGATLLVSFEVLGGEGAIDWQTVPKHAS